MENLSEVLGYTPDHIAQIGRDVLEGRQPEMRRSCTGWDEFKIVPMVKAQPRGGTSSLVTDDRFSRHYVFREDFLQRKGNPESMVMFRVWGDSMSPLISDQDVILVDQSQHHAQEGRIFVVGLDDDVLVKRIGRRPGKLVLRSENPEWEDVEIDIHDESIDCRIYGKAIWIGKELV
jgi:phage repressor protein C with HTH and peptisase S24 domain